MSPPLFQVKEHFFLWPPGSGTFWTFWFKISSPGGTGFCFTPSNPLYYFLYAVFPAITEGSASWSAAIAHLVGHISCFCTVEVWHLSYPTSEVHEGYSSDVLHEVSWSMSLPKYAKWRSCQPLTLPLCLHGWGFLAIN